MLHKMELFSHRDFINAIEKYRHQVDLSKETNDFMIKFLADYKNICGTFIGDINGLLMTCGPNYKVEYAPLVMEKERFHLLGLMAKILCTLTQKIKEMKPHTTISSSLSSRIAAFLFQFCVCGGVG